MLLNVEQQDEVKNQAKTNILTMGEVFKTDYKGIFTPKFFDFIYENKRAVIGSFLTNYAVIPNLVDGKVDLERLPYYDELELELYNLVSALYSEFIDSLRS